MTVTLHSTAKIVTLEIDGNRLPARVWEGTTAGGVKCHAFITRIAVHESDDASEFERELQEQAKPSAAVVSIPLHLIL
jgi:hypothetical protein